MSKIKEGLLSIPIEVVRNRGLIFSLAKKTAQGQTQLVEKACSGIRPEQAFCSFAKEGRENRQNFGLC